MKILIVDDNPVNAEMIRFSLEKEKYEPIMASGGEEALACLDAHPDLGVVVTDVMMPGMDGLQLLELIRQRPECKTLPVIVATSLANEPTVRQAVALQCKHFIVKPFTIPLLLHTVRAALAERGVVLEDRTRVASRLGIDTAGYDQLALAFATVVHGRVRTLQDLAGRDAPPAIDAGLQRDLRTLEESAALLGAERLMKTLAAFGLPDRAVPSPELGGVCKALLAELRALATALPSVPSEPDAAPSPTAG
jgi:CheY-like chemotaxis protein